eukprot:5288997-Pleurochrysis_carterae.AAC.1
MHAEISSKSAAREKLEPFGRFASSQRNSCRRVGKQDRREDEPTCRARAACGAQRGPLALVSLRPARGCARLRIGARAQQQGSREANE